jgi:hypothetical protein
VCNRTHKLYLLSKATNKESYIQEQAMVRKSNTRGGHCGDEQVQHMEATFSLASSIATTGTKATFEVRPTKSFRRIFHRLCLHYF